MSGPAAAMGDSAPARSLDDIDLSALRVSTAPSLVPATPAPLRSSRRPGFRPLEVLGASSVPTLCCPPPHLRATPTLLLGSESPPL